MSNLDAAPVDDVSDLIAAVRAANRTVGEAVRHVEEMSAKSREAFEALEAARAQQRHAWRLLHDYVEGVQLQVEQ